MSSDTAFATDVMAIILLPPCLSVMIGLHFLNPANGKFYIPWLKKNRKSKS